VPSSHSADPVDDLPFVDEYRTQVSAPAPAVWSALRAQLTRSRLTRAGTLAHLLAAEPRRSSGNLPDEGATVPGFTVAEAVAGQRLRLTGRHRFSRYALIFTLTAQPGGTVLSARTLARFPGFRGWIYRRLVIGTGGHRILLTRLLDSVRRHAEGQGAR
jgi:hypothetical protein